MAITNSYMITNRATPGATHMADIKPLSSAQAGALWWYMSPKPNDTNVNDYEAQSSNPSAIAPSNFINTLVTELQQQAKPQLALYIHGLGNTWPDAVSETGYLGQYISTNSGFTGTVIGFSWPSFDFTDSVDPLFYSGAYAFPPTPEDGTIRGNIGGSYKSFGSVMSFLENLSAAVPGLTISIMCHSEGNYMLMTGLYNRPCVVVDQIMLMAADTNNAALQSPPSGLVGQGSGIVANAKRVTVYYSANDPTLAAAVGVFGPLLMHNPEYGGRLGINGPSFNYGQQSPNVVGVDCSLVVSEQNVSKLADGGVIPAGTDLHSSYRFIPQILDDLTQTANGAGSGSVVNRKQLAAANSYLMSLVSP